jgi:rSAM-associated Gly-rich repeat protein
MPSSRSAGLLAFLLALPSLVLALPPASDATAAAEAGAPPASDGPPAAGQASVEARLRRLSAAIRARSALLDEGQRGPLRDEPWLAAGGWWNGNNRGWLNRGWANGAFNRNFNDRPPQMWANFRPGWRNFGNGPRFLNW